MGSIRWQTQAKGARNSMAAGNMQARDLIWLAALGVGAREAFDLDQLGAVIDDLAGRIWTPVGDVMAGCLEEMHRSGSLNFDQGRYATTDQGRQILGLLLGQPSGPAGCPLGQVGLRLKLAFLDLVPPRERQDHLGPIIEACRGELAECRRRCELCATHGPFGRQWLRHETERLRRDLGLLLSMRDEPAVSMMDGLA